MSDSGASALHRLPEPARDNAENIRGPAEDRTPAAPSVWRGAREEKRIFHIKRARLFAGAPSQSPLQIAERVPAIALALFDRQTGCRRSLRGSRRDTRADPPEGNWHRAAWQAQD